MQKLIDFIMAGQTDFTPEVLIRYMVFVLVLACIGSIVNSITYLRR